MRLLPKHRSCRGPPWSCVADESAVTLSFLVTAGRLPFVNMSPVAHSTRVLKLAASFTPAADSSWSVRFQPLLFGSQEFFAVLPFHSFSPTWPVTCGSLGGQRRHPRRRPTPITPRRWVLESLWQLCDLRCFDWVSVKADCPLVLNAGASRRKTSETIDSRRL